jgi:hypothetical protein
MRNVESKRQKQNIKTEEAPRTKAQKEDVKMTLSQLYRQT